MMSIGLRIQTTNVIDELWRQSTMLAQLSKMLVEEAQELTLILAHDKSKIPFEVTNE